MKYYLIAVSSLLLGTTLASSAYAANPNGNWYLGASGDLTWLNHSDMGGGGNINLGYRFMPSTFGAFRLEAEAGYHSADGKGAYGNTHYFTYMGNAYYDFRSFTPSSSSGWQVVPYIGAGIGDAAVHSGASSNNFTTTFHHNNDVFAYQGMAGLTFVSGAMPNTDWSIGYRYLGTSEVNGTHLHANNAELGVRFHF